MNWDEYLMGFARHAALKSKDSTQVGCVIVGPDKAIRMTGYNGLPSGVADTPDRYERPLKYSLVSMPNRVPSDVAPATVRQPMGVTCM